MLNNIQPSEELQSLQDVNTQSTSNFLDAINSGLTQKLRENNFNVVSKSRFFANCNLAFCGKENIKTTLQFVKQQTSEIGLIVFYTINPTLAFYDQITKLEDTYNSNTYEPLSLEITVIDPTTFEILLTERLRLLEKLSYQALFVLAQDMGTILLQSVNELTPKRQYDINLDKFIFEELNGFSTYMMANLGNQYLRLLSSSQENTLFGQFFPLQNTQYELVSTMPVDSLKNYISAFFRKNNTDVKVSVKTSTDEKVIILVSRVGNPYTPSFLNSLVLVSVIFAIVVWIARRKVLNAKLEYYSDNRNASKWLKTHQDAKFAPYLLVKKWASPAIYWSRVAEESMELYNQAKLYFEAGDVNTSKLFLSKSLHLDTGNKFALELTNQIKEFESRKGNLSKDEQLIRNKLAKALSNHKDRKSHKALKQLYQAEEIASQNKKLKKQSKAINKLIKRIKKSISGSIESFAISSAVDSTGIIVFNTSKIYLGRLPKTVDLTWINMSDGIFPINHSLMSRIGKHGEIFRENESYFYRDLHSKNGSFLNRKQCTANQREKLKNNDLLQLGSKHPAKSVGLDVHIPTDHSFMKMSFNEVANNLLTKADLNKLWPDNLLAQCNKLVYLSATALLLLDEQNGAIELVSTKDTVDFDDTLNKWIPVAHVSLEPAPMITPINNSIDLLINDIMVLGEMPLILPCELKIKDFIIKFNHYEVTANPFNQQELLE